MPETRLFRQEYERGPSKAPRGEVRYFPLPLGAAKSLNELPAYAFYSLGMLYRYAGFHDGILTDFLESTRLPVMFYHHHFQRPIFTGLEHMEERAWNHVLMAIPKQFESVFTDFMNSVCLHHRQRGLVIHVGVQRFQVPDPLAQERYVILPTPVPTVEITAFGINANVGIMYFGQPEMPFSPRPVRQGPSQDALKVFAWALKEQKNPHVILEQLSRLKSSNSGNDSGTC